VVEVLSVARLVADANFEEYGEAFSECLEVGAVDTAEVFIGKFLEVREFSL
jgi:hypothetical protein